MMDDFSPSQEDIDDAISRLDAIAPAKAITALDEDPDSGARALELSRATGVPAPVIHADVDGFEKQHRSSLVGQILQGNDQLAEYIRTNALADVVSNDDYGNMDKFSKSVPEHTFLDSGRFRKFTTEPIYAGLKGAFEGAKEAFTEPYRPEDLDPLMKASAPTRYAFHALDLSRRLMGAFGGAIMGGAGEFARQEAEAITGSSQIGESIGREVRGILESEMGRSGEHLGEIAEVGQRQKITRARADAQAFEDAGQAQTAGTNVGLVAKPWLDAEIEPPRGLHPEIDAAKADLNATVLDALDKNLADAATSLTRERSPEMFQKFAEQHYGNSTIGISGDRVLELYGDRIPDPNDGLLGWVPGIEDKLAAARATGDDIHVPLADWMARVDPKIAKDLHDDLRVWPGGITAAEAKEPWEPRPVVDSPMAQVREATGTEPMFSFGDKKLELKTSPQYFEGMDEFKFYDQDGKSVGELTIIPDSETKTLYVANINGLAGLYSNSFGPSLIRDLKKQLKAIYPEFEWLTGHRVSGARHGPAVSSKHTGTGWESVEGDTHFPKVRLSLEEGHTEFREMLEDRFVEDFGHGVVARLEPSEFLSQHHAEISQAISDEITRIAGRSVDFVPVSDIQAPGIVPGAASRGVYFPSFTNAPKILIDLFGPDPIGVTRHESIHHLKSQGLFTVDEWNALVNASEDEGWFARYEIEARYPTLNIAKKHEEAIAEAFRDWMQNRDKVLQPNTLVTQAFEKIRQIWEAVQARFKEIFGRELSVDELFRKVESGELKERTGTRELGSPAFSIEDAKAKLDNLRAEAAGLDARSFKKIQGLIQERFKSDVAASLARAEREQKTIQSKEWKENAKQIAKDVEANIRQRPDVMADLLIGSGELAGKKLKQRFPLRAEDLTSEQRAALPRHYYSQDGLPIDGVAKMVGYTSGDAMLEKLIEYNKEKGNLTAQEMLKQTIDAETARRMEEKFGDLKANIMLEAADQALSENNLNILAEEWQGAAMSAGVSVVDKDVAKAEALRLFGQKRIAEIDSTQLMTQMQRHYRDATRALIQGKPAEALVSLERRYMNGLMAAEARKLEKELKSFERTAKQFAKREVKTIAPEYTNFIHQILMQVGKSVRRSSADLAAQIEGSGWKNLEEFVQSKTDDLREVPVWDQLFDPAWKKDLDSLSTEEFRAVHGSVKTLVHNGRDELKIYKQGEAEDFAQVKEGLIQAVADSVDGKVRPPRGKSVIKSYYVKHLQMENIFNRWDAFDSKGLWNQYIMRDLVDGANQVDAWKKEYANKIKGLGTPKDINRAVDNPIFKDMDTETLIPFSRKNLIAVMLNMGTGTGAKSNLTKLAKGYGLATEDVVAWVHQHATADEWKFVQGIWDIFAEIKVKSDTMYRSLTGGVAPESVPIFPIDTPHGQIKGGYYPIIFHSEMEGKSKKLMGKDALEQENFIRATTPAGYTKSRTGYVAPLALDMDQIPGRISQMLHDVGLRPAVLNAAKVFYDHDVRSAIRKHYGEEYKQELIPYLQAVANSSNRIDKSQQAFARLSEFARQNIITTLVGLNPGTVMKHGPSALVTSIREVGPKEFANAVTGLFRVNEVTGETNWQFAIKNSLELQRRDRNWGETLYGATESLDPGEKFTPWRARIMELSAKPVAFSDMLSAVPTWLAKYEGETKAGASHGDAVFAADRAVRRAHGSTAITNRTAMMREANPWLTSVYNFFSDIMNRQMETIWRAGETLDLVKEGQKKAAIATVPGLTASLFAYALWPAIVEHLVAPGEDEPKDPWAKKAAKQMAFTLSSSWVGVRDVASAMVHGRDPQFGLTGTAFQEITNLFRDFTKDDPFRKDHAGRLIQDAASFVGAATGMLPAQVGRSIRFAHDVKAGQERPKGPWAWVTGLRFGTTKHHSTTFDEYIRGHR